MQAGAQYTRAACQGTRGCWRGQKCQGQQRQQPRSGTRLRLKVRRTQSLQARVVQRLCTTLAASAPSASGTPEPTASTNLQHRWQSLAQPLQRRWKSFCDHPSSQLVISSWELLWAHLWPMVALFSLSDGIINLLQGVSHRLTNEVAIRALSVSPADIGNLWFLTRNPSIAGLSTGYGYIAGFAFLASFPLNLLIRTLTVSAAVLLCHTNVPASGSQLPAKVSGPADSTASPTPSAASTSATDVDTSIAQPSPISSADAAPVDKKKRFRPSLSELWATAKALRQALGPIWKRVFLTDLLVIAWVLPLQVASLALVSLPWTLPRLLDLQAANPAAVLDGYNGKQAMARSKEVVQPVRASMALPFFGLIILAKLLLAIRLAAIALFPPRFFWDLPEIPIVASLGISLLSATLQRMHDLLPLAVYQKAQQKPA